MATTKQFIVLKSATCSASDDFLSGSIEVDSSKDFEKVQQAVAKALHIALWKTVSFVAVPASSKSDADSEDAKKLESIEDITGHDGDVGVLVSGKRLRNVPGPTGGLPFVRGYSEIFPDFIGNQQRLLDKYGHLVHVNALGKNTFYTDDPELASVVLSEGDYFQKNLTTEHPLYALHENLPNGLFTANSSNPNWAKSHSFIQVALGGKAMRGYGKVMDHSAVKLVGVFKQFQEKGTIIDAFPWTMRAAGNTIAQIVLGRDLGMLDGPDSEIAKPLVMIGRNLAASQALYRNGKLYRLIPGTPERRTSYEAESFVQTFLKEELKRTVDEYQSKDLDMKEAALECKSIMDYTLHALDKDGEKMPISLALENISTLLAAGQVTTSSLLAWLLMVLCDHPDEADALYAALLDAGLRVDSEPTIEQLQKVERLDWFVKETQRLYNPAFQPTRSAMQDTIVPGAYFVHEKSQVTVALHSVMVNSEHWDNPWKFDVDRWGTEKVQKRHSHAYIPFATGGRSCIGFNLALAETKQILTRLVLNFTFKNESTEKVVYDPNFSLFRPLNLKIRVLPQQEPDAFLAEYKKAHAEKKEKDASSKNDEKKETERPQVGRSDLPAFYAIHASNSGTCKGFASELTKRARELGFGKVQLLSLDGSPLESQEKIAKLAGEENIVVVVTCTYNGEPPESAITFDSVLDDATKAKDNHHFAGIHYAVFGAGNKQWGATFQAFPNKVDATMSSLGGDRIFEKGSGNADEDQDRDWSEWQTKFWCSVAAKHGIDLENPSKDTSSEASEGQPAQGSGDAIEVKFQEASKVQTERTTPIGGFLKAEVTENIELVDNDATPPRGMRLITMSLPEGMSYRAGDHVEIVPENNRKAIETVLARLQLVEQATFEVKVLQEESLHSSSLAATLAGKGAITVHDALQFHADLSAPIQRNALQHIVSLLPEGDKARDEISRLADPGNKNSKEDTAEFLRRNRNFATLLEHFPSIGGVLSLKDLLLCVKSIATRRYSIASSPLADSKSLKICVGVNPVKTEEGTFEGLASGFLKRSSKGQALFVRTRAAQDAFHLPEDPATPIILVAAGTGIAPFLGFLEERKARDMKLSPHGGNAKQFTLYYGATEHDMAQLKKKLRTYVDEGYVDIHPIYSAEDNARKFAQDLLIRDGLDVWSTIKDDGHIYVCGSAARVGAGVEGAIIRIAQQVGGHNDPDHFFKDLKRSGKLAEDVFG